MVLLVLLFLLGISSAVTLNSVGLIRRNPVDTPTVTYVKADRLLPTRCLTSQKVVLFDEIDRENVIVSLMTTPKLRSRVRLGMNGKTGTLALYTMSYNGSDDHYLHSPPSLCGSSSTENDTVVDQLKRLWPQQQGSDRTYVPMVCRTVGTRSYQIPAAVVAEEGIGVHLYKPTVHSCAILPPNHLALKGQNDDDQETNATIRVLRAGERTGCNATLLDDLTDEQVLPEFDELPSHRIPVGTVLQYPTSTYACVGDNSVRMTAHVTATAVNYVLPLPREEPTSRQPPPNFDCASQYVAIIVCLVWILMWLIIGSGLMCIRDYRVIAVLRGNAATAPTNGDGIPYASFSRRPIYR